MPQNKHFFSIKENILALDSEISALKSLILKQNEVIKELSERIVVLSSKIEELEKSPNQPISTGNEGVNQSINHLINQSLINQSLNHIHLSIPQEPILDGYLPEITVDETNKIDEKPIGVQQRSETDIDLGTINTKKSIDHEISFFKTNINRLFSSLSKQELKVFLTLYQLDDDGNAVSYLDLASHLSLTESCIRGYISGLIRKGLPITRKKINNKRTILTLSKDFKSLGLKQRLVSLYYEIDPRQTTLFDRV